MRKSISQKTLAFLVLFLGIFLLSAAPLIIRWADAPGVVTSFYRMLIAACAITIINLFRKRPRENNLLPGNVWILPILAGISSGIDHSLWSTAIGNTYIAKANLLNYIAPLWVGLAAVIFFRQKYGVGFWLGLFIVLLGAWGISGTKIDDFSAVKFTGEGYAFLSSFFYAAYMILSEQSRRYYGSLNFVQISSFAAAVILAVIMLVNGYSFFRYSPTTFLLFLIVGLFSQMGGYFCLVYSLGKLPAPIVSPVLILQPVLTALWAAILFHEKLRFTQLIGGGLVLIGVYIISRSKPKAAAVKSTHQTK